MDNLHIFFALNDSYTSHYCVTMVSVLTNTPNRHCHFYLLTDYISEKNKGRFSRVEKQYANCSIHYQLITEKIFDSFHRNIDYLVSPVSYYRYIIPELSPQLDKALYLDGDLVVNGSLEKLWDTDITDYLCAGVHDLWIENINYKPQIGFSSDELYINAGVLLLNIPKMREEKIYEKLCETTISLGKQIQFQDQDIINIVCRGRVKELPERYNFTTENAIKHPQERDKAIVLAPVRVCRGSRAMPRPAVSVTSVRDFPPVRPLRKRDAFPEYRPFFSMLQRPAPAGRATGTTLRSGPG